MESFHCQHDYDLVTKVLYFKDGLIKSLDIIFQAFSIFLMNNEEVRGILLLDPTAHKIGDKEPTQVTK